MPHLTDVREHVDRLVDETLRETTFFRVDVTAKGTARAPVISVYLDGDEGIDIGNCATISRELHSRIEEAGICPNGFELNVSSPGLDRSLRLPRQYARHVGRDVRLEVEDIENSETTIEGRLVGAAEDAVRIEAAAGEITLPLRSIRKAVVKAAW